MYSIHTHIHKINPHSKSPYVLSFQSNQPGMYPSHTYIHKIVPYIVACISPYKGQSYVFSFQSNQTGTYPSHAHIHKIVPYIVARISPYKVDLMCSPSRVISQGCTQAMPTYRGFQFACQNEKCQAQSPLTLTTN